MEEDLDLFLRLVVAVRAAIASLFRYADPDDRITGIRSHLLELGDPITLSYG
jgi:hypothetical protein